MGHSTQPCYLMTALGTTLRCSKMGVAPPINITLSIGP